MPDLKRLWPDSDTMQAFRLALEGGIVGAMLISQCVVAVLEAALETRAALARAV